MVQPLGIIADHLTETADIIYNAILDFKTIAKINSMHRYSTADTCC